MNLRIIKGGMLDTIQDKGRYGYQHLGINPGGAMDILSAQYANVLVGNDADEAVIEIHFPASEFFFEHPALIAVSGANFSPHINGDEIPCMQPILVSKFSILQFYWNKTGARTYLAIRGGFDVPQWFDSYTTNIRANAGGFKGRTLQKDDEIGICSGFDYSPVIGKKEFQVLPWKADADWEESEEKEILILPGNEWGRLTDESKERLLQQPFTITNQSDRMGYRLNAEPLSMETNGEMISSAVNFGTVQLLPNGQLAILMADHQTSGGYPRVAHIISAHHSRLAQMRPGHTMRFAFTDLQTAHELYMKQQKHVLQLQYACKFKLDELLKK
jgi:antagonist of KipI